MKKIWFRRKLYGWGWTPVTWEGWLVILIWVILFIPLIRKTLWFSSKSADFDVIFTPENQLKNFIFILISTGILILISYLKGEKPKWQWGKRIEDENQNPEI